MGSSPCGISRPRHLEAAAGQARSSFGQVLFREERRRSSAPSHCRTAALGQADRADFVLAKSGSGRAMAGWCGWADGYFTRHFCASIKSRSTEGYRDRAWPLESTSSRSRQCEREETRSTTSAPWQQISTSNSSNIVSITRIQTISGGAGDSAVWPPELRFDKKNPLSVPRKDRRRQHPRSKQHCRV